MDISEPVAKRSRIPDEDHCVICTEALDRSSRGPAVRNPTVIGLQSLLDAAKRRSDDVYRQLWPLKDDILRFDYKVYYHKSCRAAYTSKSNITCIESEEPQASCSSAESQTRKLRRDDTCSFNIREHCFICGASEKRLPDKCKEKLTPISTGTGKNTRTRVMQAAEQRNDTVVKMRMLSYHDLFAYDAKYHRSCYAHYISERNLKASATNRQEREASSHDKAFYQLVKEIEDTVLSRKVQRVVTLSSLREKMIALMITNGTPDEKARNYSGWKLKARMESHFQDRLSFIERRGLSDLICASTVTVGDALKKAVDLASEKDKSEDEDYLDIADHPGATVTGSIVMEEARILHTAAGILRNKMAEIKDCSDAYIPASQVKMQQCRNFVPDELYDFVMWCTSDKAFQNVIFSRDEGSMDVNLRVLSVCHSFIGLAQKLRTPLALGLGMHVHHDFGSKQLIDIFHSLGHSVSYDEIRRFLTSAAKDQIEQTNDVYIPHGLQSFKDYDLSTIIDAAIDNFDQNENTLDGKTTTHAMATVLYQRCEVTSYSDAGIPRSQEKALDVTEYTDKPVIKFPKPHEKSEPTPVPHSSFLDVNKQVTAKSKEQDLVWELATFVDKDNQVKSIPGWSGFNRMTAVEKVHPTTIRYLPFLNAPPTDFSTIYTTLLKLVALAEKHGQMHIVVTADLAIYSKAQQIIWSKPESLAGKVTMRLGGMHHLMAFIATIGKLFGDGGLQQLLTVTGVYADSTARMMLQGKQLARAVRGIKLVLQALSHIHLKSALAWSQTKGLPWIGDEAQQALEDLQTTFRMKDRDSSMKIISTLNITGVDETLKQFNSIGRAQSATFTFWEDFMEAAHIMLRLLRAERDADFILHLQAVSETTAYFFLADRHNYARYTPVYVAEMKQLDVNHPAIYRHLCSGGFVVRRSSKRLFNCVPTDQALEQTVNRESKSQGGVVGFTLRKGALARWLLTRHITGSYSEAMKQMCVTDTSSDVCEELGRSRLSRDISDVEKIIDAIESQYQNPFDLDTVPNTLINIVTGQKASKEVEDCIITMKDVGNARMTKFIEKYLAESTKASFWAPLPKVKIKTFADMRKALPGNQKKKIIVSAEVLFRRLFAVSKLRDIDLQAVLKHELAAVPPALFNDDGSMRKTTKSDLAKKLESVCDAVHTLPAVMQQGCSSAYIIDGMAMLQSLNDTFFKTFDDLAKYVLQMILRLLHSTDMAIDCVTVVFDCYKADSIKTMERERRGAAETTASHLVTSRRDVPNYRTFLKSAANKAALAEFLCESITTKAQPLLQCNKSIVLAGGFSDNQTVKSVTNSGIVAMTHMFSTQEEADTRMVLHAIDLSNTHHRILVRCDDTDVLVILLYYYSRGLLAEEIYMHAGHSGKLTTRERYIPIHTIAKKLVNTVCQCLPAVHALTGCDTTSGFFRIGKRTPFTTLVENVDSLADLAQFGVSSTVTMAVNSARSFVMLLYGKRGKQCRTLDDLRYVFATTTDKEAAMLPPTEDAFKQHVMRAQMQASIWCHSHDANPQLDDPVGHGWTRREDGLLEPTMYENECAPVEVRDITHLYCTDKNCTESRKCPCKMAGLPCIETCSCTDCPNAPASVCDESDDDDDE